MSQDQPFRRRLFPDGIERVQLYRSTEVLAGAIARCRAAGWQALDFDVLTWLDGDRIDRDLLHDDLQAGFGFPHYYGRNLDALSDVMGDVAEGRCGFDASAPGALIVFRRFDRLASADRRLAFELIDIMTSATGRALAHGWPLAVLIQSDDPDIAFEPVDPIVVAWNAAERRRTNRDS